MIKMQLLQIVVDSVRDSKVGVVFDPKSLIEALAKLIARYTRSHITGQVWMTAYGIHGNEHTWLCYNQPLIIWISGLISRIYLNRLSMPMAIGHVLQMNIMKCQYRSRPTFYRLAFYLHSKNTRSLQSLIDSYTSSSLHLL